MKVSTPTCLWSSRRWHAADEVGRGKRSSDQKVSKSSWGPWCALINVDVAIDCATITNYSKFYQNKIVAGKVNGKLWEFIRDLLLSERTNPSFIRWERREDGIFKFVQSDKVAKMWGERKQNPKMTYEKLSRAMRYYYKSKVLLPVFGRRLVYKFGPNATGWLPSASNNGAVF